MCFYHPNKAVPELAESLKVLEMLASVIPSEELEDLRLEEAQLIANKIEKLDKP